MANFHYIIKIIDYYARNRTVTFSNWHDGQYHSSSTGGGGPGGAQFECVIPNNIIITDATFYHSGSNTSTGSRVGVSQNSITLSKAGTNIVSCSTGNHNHSLIGDNNQLLIEAGDTLTCAISQSFTANTSTPMAGGGPGNITYTATAIQQNVYLDLICEVPMIHEVLTASDIIKLSSIFNTTPVSQNDIIALNPVQEIGTQVGTMFYGSSNSINVFNEATINNTVGPVTFSTTEPQYTDIIAVTDKMTDNYYAVQATRL